MARYENTCESCGYSWSSRRQRFRCSKCQRGGVGLARVGCGVVTLLLVAAAVAAAFGAMVMLPEWLEPAPPAVAPPRPKPAPAPKVQAPPTPAPPQKPAPLPAPPPPKPVAELGVHGRSGAPVNGQFKVVITVENTGDAIAEGVSVRVRFVADGVDLETVDAAGPRSIEPNSRAKFRATYDGEHVGLVKDFVPEVKFRKQ